MNESSRDPSADQWQACPPGELATIGIRLRTARRRRTLRIAGGSVATVLALVAVVWTSMDMPWSLPWRNSIGKIDCPTCKARLADYERGALPQDQMAEVRAHLAGCAWCEWYRNRILGRNVDGNEQADGGSLAYAGILPRFDLRGAFAPAGSRPHFDAAGSSAATEHSGANSHDDCDCCGDH